MAVRLEPSEHAAWSAVLAASPWRSLAHWCREVVSDALARSLKTPDRVTELADISDTDAAHFVHLCAQLNELAKGSNRLGRVVADSLDSARSVADVAAALLPEITEREASSNWRGTPSNLDGERRTKLVNVRLTDEEFAKWSDAAKRAGYTRVSMWVRHTVASLIDYTLAPVPLTVPSNLDGVRNHLAGAVNNLAQLSDLADSYDQKLAMQFAQIHATIVELLRRYHALGRRT